MINPDNGPMPIWVDGADYRLVAVDGTPCVADSGPGCGGEVHPMHLHGHHAVVLSRNGVPATGSPWWMDSVNVNHGESYDIAFLVDNPGIWMDHCHNLPHAAQGCTRESPSPTP